MNQLFYNIFNPKENFFLRDLSADVMSVHNRNMKHTRAIEFDKTNLLAMLLNLNCLWKFVYTTDVFCVFYFR